MGICPFGCLQFFHANKFLSLSLSATAFRRRNYFCDLFEPHVWPTAQTKQAVRVAIQYASAPLLPRGRRNVSRRRADRA